MEVFPKSLEHLIVEIKWVLKNKLDEQGNITRNIAILVVKEYNQIKGINFDQTSALVARLKTIRNFLHIYIKEALKYIKWFSKVFSWMVTLRNKSI